MQRNHFLDLLKGALIFLVVTGHVLQHVIYLGGGYWEDPLFRWIYMFHMPLFMAVAGYLTQPGIDRVSVFRAIQTRFMAYVVPVTVWSALFCIIVSLLTNGWSPSVLAKLPVYVFERVVGDLWFLWALFGSIVFTVLARLAGKAFPIAYVLSFILVLLLPEYENVIFFKFTYLFFQIGYALARWGIPGFLITKKSVVFIAAAIFGIIAYRSFTTGTYVYNSGMLLAPANFPNLMLRYAGAVSMSIAFTYTLYFVHGWLPQKVRSVFYLLGRDSIYIYIIQNYVFVAVDKAGGRIHYPKPDLWLSWLVALLGGLVICAGCYFAGAVLARSAFLSTILFGKRPKRAAIKETIAVSDG